MSKKLPSTQTLAIFVFNSQGSNFAEQIHTLVELGSRSSTLSSFLCLSLAALSRELNSIEDLELLSHLPPPACFESIQSLTQHLLAQGFRDSVVNGILLSLTQLGYCIAASADDTLWPLISDHGSRLLGFCTGLISASALRKPPADVWDLVKQSVEVVRLTFWIGVRSQASRYRFTCGFDFFRREQMEGCWSSVLFGCSTDVAESLVSEFNHLIRLPEPLRIIITAISGGAVSVGGFPPVLEVFSEWLATPSCLEKARISDLHIYSPYHNPLLNDALEEVMDDVARRAIGCMADDRRHIHVGGDQRNSRILYDTFTALPFNPRLDGRELTKSLIATNLTQPARWDSLTANLCSDEQLFSASNVITLVSVGPASSLCANLASSMSGSEMAQSKGVKVHVLELHAVLNQLKSNLKSVPRPLWSDDRRVRGDDIAIISMACRFPGDVNNPQQLWTCLETGRLTSSEHQIDKVCCAPPLNARTPVAVTINVPVQIPPHLFDLDSYYGHGTNQMLVRHMHALSSSVTTTMDTRLFSISPKEAEQMDPSHRLTMLTAYEALERAGYSPACTNSFSNKRIGIWMGASSDDYRENASQDIGSYFITGNIRAFITGHVSFAMNWEGPSNSVDTAEGSGIAAIECARNALLSGQCDVALAGSVNVITQPVLATIPSTVQGYLLGAGQERGEPQKQSDLFRLALSQAGLSPSDVTHFEASGHHTSNGEAEEFSCISDVFSQHRDPDRPLTVSSSRPNLGAGEAASTILSIIKAVLILERQTIPRQVGITSLNPVIACICEEGKVTIPFEARSLVDLKRKSEQHAIMVNSISSANLQSVAVLKPVVRYREYEPLKRDHRDWHIITLSARTEESLLASRSSLIDYLYRDVELSDLSYTLTSRRVHHPFRVTVVATDRDELSKSLRRARIDEIKPAKELPDMGFCVTFFPVDPKELGDLLRADPDLADIYIELLKVAHSLSLAIEEEETGRGEAGLDFNYSQETNKLLQSHAQAFIFQIAVSTRLKAWGISPTVLISEGASTITALVLAEVLDVYSGLYLLKLAYAYPASVKRVGVRLMSEKFSSKTIHIQSAGKSVGCLTPGEVSKESQDLIEEMLANVAYGTDAERHGRVSGDTFDDAYNPWIVFDSRLLRSVPGTRASGLLNLEGDVGVYRNLANIVGNLHSEGYAINWNSFHSSFLPGLRLLTDLPTYKFSLAKYWMPYIDRNLIRANSAADSALATLTAEPCVSQSQGRDIRARYEMELDLSPTTELVAGHVVHGVPIVPTTFWAEAALEVGHDLCCRIDIATMWEHEIRDLSILNPLKMIEGGKGQTIAVQAHATGEGELGRIDLEFSSRDAGGGGTTHATCWLTRFRAQESEAIWSRIEDVLKARLTEVRKNGEMIGHKLTYRLLEPVVHFTEGSGYRGIASASIMKANAEAITRVVAPAAMFQGQGFIVQPTLMDGLGQIAGFICTVVSEPDCVYLSESIGALRFSSRFKDLASKSGAEFHVYCRMKASDEGGSKSMSGDVFVFDHGSCSIIAEFERVKYRKVSSQHLLDVLPPLKAEKIERRSKVIEDIAAAEPELKAKHGIKGQVSQTTFSTLARSRSGDLLEKILSTIAAELGLPPSDLKPSAKFADLGLDSLMSLVCISSLESLSLGIEIPQSLFMDCSSPEELLAFIQAQVGPELNDEPDKDPVGSLPRYTYSDESDASMVHLTSKPSSKGAHGEAHKTVALEGAIYAATLDTSTLVQESGARGKNSGNHVPLAVKVTQEKVSGAKTTDARSSHSRVQPPTCLQKGDDEQGPPLFLLPDGSGAAAVYSGLPPIGKTLYGLNSAFLSDASKWNQGVRQIARAYLDSMKSVQPRGPYLVGGWSFGGNAAFEIGHLLNETEDRDDRLDLLLLLDSPAPNRFPPLPMSIVDWIFGTEEMKSIAPPALGPRLLKHFQATVDNLSTFKPKRLDPPPARVVYIVARRGVGGQRGGVEENNATVEWLMNSREGPGANGWEEIIAGGKDLIEVLLLDANHCELQG
ncbi:hypothetical protein IE53DRAFT_378496 [Violaceomyces palustris]|uniref:Uncharacterized protein n=1 Tax=Violaceomyces palustris TaxID=1673888 RepID=A0ACD0P1Y9_9BASI|nr:hypothetical protein IE53DRAFT_378496 [Violaceomyces palustris]